MKKIVVKIDEGINKINLVALFPEQLAAANRHLAMLNFPPGRDEQKPVCVLR